MFTSQQFIPLKEVCGRYINAKRHAGALFMLRIGIKLWCCALQLQAIAFPHMPYEMCHTTVLTACSKQAVWRARVAMQQHGKGMMSNRPELTSLTDEPVEWHCVLDPVVPWHVKRGHNNLGQEHALIIKKESCRGTLRSSHVYWMLKHGVPAFDDYIYRHLFWCDILVYNITAILCIFRAC